MSTPLNLSGLDLPRRNGELAFDAPWQSTVFALAAAVVENALGGDREPFRHQLIAAIAADPTGKAGPPHSRHSCKPCPHHPRPDRASPAPVTVGDHHSDRAEARRPADLHGEWWVPLSVLCRAGMDVRFPGRRCG